MRGQLGRLNGSDGYEVAFGGNSKPQESCRGFDSHRSQRRKDMNIVVGDVPCIKIKDDVATIPACDEGDEDGAARIIYDILHVRELNIEDLLQVDCYPARWLRENSVGAAVSRVWSGQKL